MHLKSFVEAEIYASISATGVHKVVDGEPMGSTRDM